MRSGIITGTSTKEEIWGTLTGIWGTFRRGVNNEWLVTKCPFFIHMEAVLDAGRHELPIAPNNTKALYWTAKDGSGSLVIKAGTTGFTLEKPAFVEVTIFGESEDGKK